jgi:DNA-binding transcriptional LysR family regulator
MTNDYRYNLNLLIALDALIKEKNVTNAGKRIFITQAAMSNILKKLREIFGDELLIREGRDMALTSRAKELAPQLEEILMQTNKLFSPSHFDPSTSQRTFIIGMTEYADFMMLPLLYEYLERHAPSIHIEVKNIVLFDETRMLESGEIELAIGIFYDIPSNLSQTHEVLFKEHLVCIARKGHPFFEKSLTLPHYLEAKHLCFFVHDKTISYIIDTVLSHRGYRRQVMVKASHIIPALHTIAQTGLVATITEGVAKQAAKTLELVVRPSPIRFPEALFAQIWLPKHVYDRGHLWLRELIRNLSLRIKQSSLPLKTA